MARDLALAPALATDRATDLAQAKAAVRGRAAVLELGSDSALPPERHEQSRCRP